MELVPSWSCSKTVYKPVWHISLLSVQWINSWWWTEKLSKTCRVSSQNKFVKLVHLVGFIVKKCCFTFILITVFPTCFSLAYFFLLPLFFFFGLSADSLWNFHYKSRSVFDNFITDIWYAYSLLITNLLQKRDINEFAQLIVFKGIATQTELEIANWQTYHWKEEWLTQSAIYS